MKKAGVKNLQGEKMAYKRRFSVERGKSMCVKEKSVKSRNNSVAL